MADMRSLKVALLADVKDFISGLDNAKKSTNSFGDNLGKVLKTAGAAFLGLASAAGAASLAIGVSSVKAAIEAQKEDALLEQSIKNLTGATATQTKATFDYLDAAENAAGVNSDQLKPSFERILRSVKDLIKTQNILDVAQNVAAGTGKSLSEVADSLARAYDGNTKGLKDLGIKLETTRTITKKVKVSKEDLAKAELSTEAATLAVQKAQERLNKVLNNNKSSSLDVAQAQNSLERAQLRAGDASDVFEKKQKNVGKSISETKEVARPFADILADLSKQYEGAAARAAETYAGKIEILKTAIQKMKEEIGLTILTALTPFINWLTTTGMQALKDFVAGLTGGSPESMVNALRDVKGRVIDVKSGFDGAIGDESTGAYGLGQAVRELAQTFGDLQAAIVGTNGESTLKDFITNMTNLLRIVNAMIKPFVALVDLSQAFARSQSGARVELPDWIRNFNNAVPNFLKTPAQRSSSTSAQGGVSITINSALSDPNAIARAVTNALNTSGRYGTVRVV